MEALTQESNPTPVSRRCLLLILFLPTLLLMVSLISTNRSDLPIASMVSSVTGRPDAPREPEGGRENGTLRGEGAKGCPNGICQQPQRARSRLRRTLAFPEGSKASLRVNFKYLLFPNSTWLAYANGFRCAWDLPKEASNALPFSRSFQRRELFRDVEDLMMHHGMDGRACILRGLCEASRKILPDGGILNRVLHLLFTIPEEEEHRMEEYSPSEGGWRREEDNACESLFPNCPFSLLNIASMQFT